MRYFKLFIISVIVFSTILFCLSLLFPSTTYVSRAVNVNAQISRRSDSMIKLYSVAFMDNDDSINAVKEQYRITWDCGEFVSSTFYNTDTIIFNSSFSSNIKQAVAVYAANNGSTTVQVFYKINTPWYKPWKKFALMLNESKYGPSLDSAISRISRQF